MADKPELKSALAQIEQQFGKGAIMRLGSSGSLDVQGISTGILSLDLALGGAGLPRGRVVEAFGPESGGKTTLALSAVASVQSQGGVAALIDAENAFDPSWAKKIGVDLGGLLISQPSGAEEALKIADALVRSNAVDLVVIDSVAALVPRAELEGEIGDSHVGLQARLMSQALRMLNPAVAKAGAVLLFINQVRLKVGVMFGNPETTPGGLALKFFSSVRMEVRKVATVKDGDVATGARIRVKVVKNKVAPPFREAEFDLMFETAISREGDILDLALENGIVTKGGNHYHYGDLKLGNGRDNARHYLREAPELMAELRKLILNTRSAPVPAE